MVYVACIGLVCLSAFIGKLITKSFVQRDKFYKEMILFCEYLKNNIGFRQTKLSNLFDDYMAQYPKSSNSFNYLKEVCLNGEARASKEQSPLYFLKQEEKQAIINFFKSLGKGNSDVELSLINNFKTLIDTKSKDAESFRKTNESLTYKLSLAIGVVICILIV